MTSTNQGGLATPPTTPPAPSKADILANVLSLANQFSSCVEAFNLIHPSKDSDHAQKVALAKLGVQQGRLLIFGDAVGISSPPANIAKHMIPSHPGATNPDPTLPVNFGIRDPKLDEPDINQKVRDALNEIAGRPSHLSREELMEKYGLKVPKRLSSISYPALDTNRLEAFREKFALLKDLVRQTGGKASLERKMSISTQAWTVRDVEKFDEFVRTVRVVVDGLIALMGVKEQVDRGMKTDIKAMGWHPDLSGPIVRQDWEKLRRIREACVGDYPEYIDVTEKAMKYISEEMKAAGLGSLRAGHQPEPAARRKSEEDRPTNGSKAHEKGKEKRPGFLSMFKFKSGKNSSNSAAKDRSKSVGASADEQDPVRSMSEDITSTATQDGINSLEPVRSQSLSAVPDSTPPLNLDAKIESVPTHTSAGSEEAGIPIDTGNQLTHADTAHSLIGRRDMFKGVGRVETKDIRAKAHDWAS